MTKNSVAAEVTLRDMISTGGKILTNTFTQNPQIFDIQSKIV